MNQNEVIKRIRLLIARIERWTEKIEKRINPELIPVRLKAIADMLIQIKENLPKEDVWEYAEYFDTVSIFLGKCLNEEFYDQNIQNVNEILPLLDECLHKLESDFQMKYTPEIVDEEKKPLVSILIPTYERPFFFIQALESAVNQTYENIEVVVSDNGPSNETEELMQDYIEMYDNVRYYHLDGGNSHRNWDNCWNHVSEEAEYINFLMDDDLFALNKIEKMMKYFDLDMNISMVTSYRPNIDKYGNKLPDLDYNVPVVEKTSAIDGQTAGRRVLTLCSNWIGETTTVLFKRECAHGQLRGWSGDERYHISDYPLWLRLLEQGDMIYINEPLSFFRKHEGNNSNDPKTVVKGLMNTAIEIQTAWNRKVYLTDAGLLRQAILSWFRCALLIVKRCIEMSPDEDEYDDEYGVINNEMIDVYKELSRVFTEKKPDEIRFWD